MKVFVYEKGKKAVKIATIRDVISVRVKDDIVFFRKEDGEIITFDRKTIKSTIYQN